MSTPAAALTEPAKLSELNEVYTDAVNRAVADDRMDLVTALVLEFDRRVEQLAVAC